MMAGECSRRAAHWSVSSPSHAPMTATGRGSAISDMASKESSVATAPTVHDSAKGLRRIQAVVPEWRYHLRPNASHALPAEVPDEVNASIRQLVIEHRNGA
jgi:hypothetical protein